MTTTHTHTNGQWLLTIGEHDASIHQNATIASVSDDLVNWKENANLIASAPELLEALKGLLEVTEENYDNRHEVEAAIHAIAKAEGRGE